LYIHNIDSENLISGEYKNDNVIISTAILLEKENKETKKYKKIVLVSKDCNVRLKARVKEVNAEDYENDKTNKFESYGKIFPDSKDYPNGIKSVRYQILEENSEYDFRKIWNKNDSCLISSHKSMYGIITENKEQDCALSALMDENINITVLTGVAGTGKTFIALLAAMELLAKKRCKKIIIARPNVPTEKGLESGFRPGGVKDKFEEWMMPIIDNIEIIINLSDDSVSDRKNRKEDFYISKKAEEFFNNKTIKIQPLESIRGRSFVDTVFILDESQNASPKLMKTVLTRFGENTKIFLTGDLNQIDVPYLDKYSNGLSNLIDKFLDEPDFCFIELKQVLRKGIAEKAARLL